jgi:hypothetical protein
MPFNSMMSCWSTAGFANFEMIGGVAVLEHRQDQVIHTTTLSVFTKQMLCSCLFAEAQLQLGAIASLLQHSNLIKDTMHPCYDHLCGIVGDFSMGVRATTKQTGIILCCFLNG